MEWRPRQQPTRPEKKEGCKIRIKKSKDGRAIDKEISSACTPKQIEALTGKDITETIEDE